MFNGEGLLPKLEKLLTRRGERNLTRYEEYVQDNKMTMEAEMVLEKHLLRHKRLEARTFQQRQYIEKRIKDMDNMIKLHRMKVEERMELALENEYLAEIQKQLRKR